MHWIDTVASYLPSLIVNHLISRTTNEELPSRQEYDTVCLFADVSGFTALSEAMMTSVEGVEGLARHLNSYFEQMVRIIASEGGDVFKFVGDALIVLWPPPAREASTTIPQQQSGERDGTTPMERRVRRAAQCAFAIQEVLHNAELTDEVRLSVKIGIGMGKVSVLHLGGVYKRMEYIAVGEPLLEAFTAEHHATPGDVIISKQAHKLVKDYFYQKEVFPDMFCKIGKDKNYNALRKQNKVNMLQQSLDDPLLEVKVKGYIPGAVLRNLRPDSPEDEHWSNEIRRVTVLFVSLGLDDHTLLAAAVYDEAMKQMHEVMVAVQESVYEYEGSINKFLMDDKGSTLVAVYGLPPVGHADDPTRGVLAALRLCERLFDLAKVGSVGITTGEAFCGVVGSKTRKEYTVLGDSVNLAARLMQKAGGEDGGVLCELATKRACSGLLQFKARGDQRIKGKSGVVKVFQPYPEDFPKPKPPQYLGANVYRMIHQQQRQNYAMHKLLTSLQAYFARPAVKEFSSVSSPLSEQRARFSGSARGSNRGSAYNIRGSMTDIGMGEDDDEEQEEEQVDTLLGLGGHDSEVSEEDDGSIDIVDHHAELQQPDYPADSLHRPFETLPISLGGMEDMDGELPFGQIRQDEARSAAAGNGGRSSVAAGGVGGGGGGDPDAGATAPATADAATADAATVGAPSSTDGGATAAQGLNRSASLTAKVFSTTPVDGRGSSATSLGSAAGMGASGGVESNPGGVSPSQTATSTDPPPSRGMMRRQGDSSHLQKLFRAADGNDGSSSQPTSPSGRLRKDGRSGSSKSVASASGASVYGRSASSRSVASASGALVALPAASDSDATVPAAAANGAEAAVAPTAGVGGDGGGGGGGGLFRVSSSGGIHAGSAASVMPRSVVGSITDGTGGVGGGYGLGSSWRGRKGSEGCAGSKHARSAVASGKDEGKMEVWDNTVGDSKEELEPSKPSRRPSARTSFMRAMSGGVAVDEEQVYSSKAQRRRSSRRLSIAQNGMVPLPASAGIPQSDLGASGSCSLPRYSRLSKTAQPGAGSMSSMLSSGQGIARSGHQLPSAANAADQSLPGPAPPTLAGGSSLLTTYIPSAMKNGRRMDDSASSSTASAHGGTGMRAHPVANGDVYDECRLQVVVPRGWKWTNLPVCHRLPAIHTSEAPTFRALVDRCWEVACEEAEVKGWSQAAPARGDMVLNILGTRLMLPTEPDYDIGFLPNFIKEACGTRAFRGFMDHRTRPASDLGGAGVVNLCLLPRAEILNVQSRWLNSRICLLQHKIALVTKQTGSVVLLEGLPGAGKTEALSVFAARTMPRTALIHFTAASPYHANKKFGGWSMVLQQYLDSLHKQEVQQMQGGREDFSGSGTSRRPSVPPGSSSEQTNPFTILGHKPQGRRDRMLLRELEEYPELQDFAFLVNDVLGTSLPETVPKKYRFRSRSHSSDSSAASSSDDDELADSEFGETLNTEQRKLSILLQLVKNMAVTKPRVVVIDDAQYLDKESWTLALQVATGGPLGSPLPLMLILSFRPLIHYRAIFSSIPPDYKALTELEHVPFLKIPGAPIEEVEQLVREKLGSNVVDLNDSLFGIMEELCAGNPLMIIELVSHLKMMEPKQLRYHQIRSEEGDQGDSHNNIDVPVQVSLPEGYPVTPSLLPDKINALLTSQTDRLNSCQLMALKVASLIGKKFSTWLLYEVYPIKGHKKRLLRELAELEEQGFLVEVQGKAAAEVIETEGWPTTTPSVVDSGDGASLFSRHLRDIPNIVYLFTHGFMMEMLQLKMLKRQTNLLKSSIQKLKDGLVTQNKRRELMQLAIENSQATNISFEQQLAIDRSEKKYKGNLSVMKYKVTMSQAATNARETTRRRKDSITLRAMRRVKRPVHQKWTEALDWKKRTCILTTESLSLFTDAKDTEPSQIIFLKGANAEEELGEAFKELAFRVETNRWQKGDELVDGSERRTFTFLADSKDDRALWLVKIKDCIEVIKMLNDEAGSGKDRRLVRGNSSSRFGGGDVGAADGADDLDSTLVVTVEGADDLILEENYGKVYPYCLVDLDDQNRRTNAVQCSSVKPTWKQDLTFQVSVQQWVLSSLRIQVWHKDLFLSDDFLGHVTIPLQDVAVQDWGEGEDEDDENAKPSELKWYDLEPRGRYKRASGRLQLGVRLLMTKSTSERASAVGGVDKLKAIAERRMEIGSHAARVGQIKDRKQPNPASQPAEASHGHGHHGHHHRHHPSSGGMGGSMMSMPSHQPMLNRGASSSIGNRHTQIRASIRSMQTELETGGGAGRSSLQATRGRPMTKSMIGGSKDASASGSGATAATAVAAGGVPARGRAQSYPQPQDLGDSSRHSDRSGSGPEGDGMTVGGASASTSRMSGRSRRRSVGARRSSRRPPSDSSSIGFNANEAAHADPLTRQLMLMLLAVETKAKVSTPEEGGGGAVNREWIKAKLKELLPMVGCNECDLDQLDTHTYYCKDRKENQYGPFPAKQLVEAYNAGYINDRKVSVKEARMKGEFRPMGARALMHGPSSDEDFKSLTVWPRADAHHPLADRILTSGEAVDGDGYSSSAKDFRCWGFNIFGLDKQELGLLAATVLAETGLPRIFGINMKTFAHFMSAVGFFMERNPRVSYHNLYHAVDVMHATYLTLEKMGASGLLTELEQLALILSALCHDLDHPGLTNSFQTATESPLANLYNDQAPLEHHHLAIMFQILRREGCDILGHLEKPQRARIREVMIQGILATEMSEHGMHITKVDKLTNDFPSITHRMTVWAEESSGGGYLAAAAAASRLSSPPVAAGVGGVRIPQIPGAEADALGLADSDRLTIASALLHAADLSSPGRPFATCKIWVLRLLEEFKFQAEQERQRGLRVTVLEGSPSASQPGFIDAFLLPFFTALLPIAPGLEDEYIPNLRDNRNRWEAIAEQEARQQPGSPDNNPAGRGGGKAGDRSSVGSASSGLGSSGGAGCADDGHLPSAAPTLSTSSSITFGGERRYSGGTIGIASMLGSLYTVPTGRSISEGGIDRRVSSVVGHRDTPAEFAGLGASGGPWRRQSTMGPGVGGVGVYPARWGASARAGGGGPRDAGGGGGGRGSEGVDRAAAPAAAMGGSSLPIDVGGVEGGGSSKEDRREESKPQLPRASLPGEGVSSGGDVSSRASALPNQALPTAVQPSLAEAPPADFPEVLPE